MPVDPSSRHENPHVALLSHRTLGILLLGLLVRAAYLVESLDNPAYFVPIIDAYHHVDLAQRISEPGGLSGLFTSGRSFFYPLFLATVFKIFGPSLLAAKAAQAVVGAATCALSARLGEQLFDARTGIVAGVLVALYGPLVFWDLEFVATGWAAFWLVALLSLIVDALRHPTLAIHGLLGIAGALACLTRPSFSPALAGSAFVLAIVAMRSEREPAKLARDLAALAVGFAIIAVPAASALQYKTGRFSIHPSVGALNFYLGNHPDGCALLGVRPGPEFQAIVERPRLDLASDAPNDTAYFRELVFEYASREPAQFGAGLLRKLAQYANGREAPRNLDIYVFREWSALLTALVWKLGPFGFPWGLLFPAALIALVVRWRELPAPLLAFGGVFPLISISVFVASRYRVPIAPLLCVLAAAFATHVSTRMAKRERASVAALLAAFAIAAGATSLPGPYCEETLDYGADLLAHVGSLEFDLGRSDDARRHISQALERDPGSAKAHYELGRILVNDGAYERAVEHFDHYMASTPNYLGYYGRAAARAGTGDRRGALADLATGLEQRPDFGAALVLKGDILADQGDLEGARVAWTRALEGRDGSAAQARQRLSRTEGER